MKVKIVFNDNEYLIQLKKEDFNLEFLGNFINRLQREEAYFLNTGCEDLKSRTFEYSANTRFDHLEDK